MPIAMIPSLARLRALAEAATPGPWSKPYFDDHPGDRGWWIRNGLVGMDEYAIAVTFSLNKNGEQDAAYIAACSPDRILALIECIEAADAMRAEVGMFDDSEALRLADLFDAARAKL